MPRKSMKEPPKIEYLLDMYAIKERSTGKLVRVNGWVSFDCTTRAKTQFAYAMYPSGHPQRKGAFNNQDEYVIVDLLTGEEVE